MGRSFDEIPQFILPWVAKQKVFWVATAALSNDGLVNLSPKGIDGTFNVVNPRKVWFEDLSGSGIATVAHVRENGRITILFNAFEGFPRILRLYGRATVYEFGTPEYEALLPPEKRHISSRSIIMVDIIKVGSSCGWGVPLFEFKGQRNRIMSVNSKRELADIEAERNMDALSCTVPPRPNDGVKGRWLRKNTVSVDGLPGLQTAPYSTIAFGKPQMEWELDNDKEFGSAPPVLSERGITVSLKNMNPLFTFLIGALISAAYFTLIRPMY